MNARSVSAVALAGASLLAFNLEPADARADEASTSASSLVSASVSASMERVLLSSALLPSPELAYLSTVKSPEPLLQGLPDAGLPTASVPDEKRLDASLPDTRVPDAGLPTRSPPAARAEDVVTALPRVSISGNAFRFRVNGGMLPGAEVSILERPWLRTRAGGNGYFEFEGLEPGAELTFVMRAPFHAETQTATLEVGADDLERVSFQVPTERMVWSIATLLGSRPDPERCQMATTVTRVDSSLYSPPGTTHGEAGATVSVEPPLPPESGPIYFNILRWNVIFPDRALSETTEDGGVLFVNVPPGEYTLRAQKDGTTFREVKMRCRPGVVVNASPPYGLQAQ